MIELKIHHDVDTAGKECVTFVLEGDTYKVKDKIRQLGFRWGYPLYVWLALGGAVNDPMFRKNKYWHRTLERSYEGTRDCSSWLSIVRKELNIR